MHVDLDWSCPREQPCASSSSRNMLVVWDLKPCRGKKVSLGAEMLWGED